MQIREMTLKELYTVYDVIKQLRTELSYEEFEDLIYDMRHMEYKMFGILERGKLVCYSGAAVQTNLYHKRHLYIFDLVTDEKYRYKGYGKMMLEYLHDYAKTAACENLVLSSGVQRQEAHSFYEKAGFEKKSYLFVKVL
ncbi:GNAT family N-acetyltransferase [Sulfurimonas autotrophica]|uniref:GCN5-related N-acetyltransferase n=1 Tax=Sulfurimonas autotrophica (strain ATCC BAA-671 / DSM 16294 / JCM 11897 / OK10) TaxID=563040 RepID=E0UQ14_SULAO|nr:GNAT family N-acetyltransferase [Sulfurimonas autotrophica]ADN08689.1 GCN5-related N-acetyltransferase [Sulfurimonas autotrophica DSM 16294]